MGQAVRTIHGKVTSLTGSTTFDAMTACAGDSFTIGNYVQSSRAYLLEAWGGQSGHAGIFRVRSPQFHDDVQGIRMPFDFNPTLSGADGNPAVLFPSRVKQPLYAGDLLVVEANGTASDTAVLALHLLYEDLPGASANLRHWSEIEPRIENVSMFQVSPTAGASQDYGTSVTLTNLVALLRAGVEYAVLGFQSQLPCTSIGITGPATSNYRIAMPLSWNQYQNGNWFADISAKYGIPHIPVINGADAGLYVVDAIDAATNIATVAHIVLAELG